MSDKPNLPHLGPVSSINLYDDDIWDEIDDISEAIAPVIEEGAYTEDFPWLQRKEFHYLFTYGTLKKGFRLSNYLKKSELVSFGYTQSDNFWMVKTKGAPNFPIILFDNRTQYKARVFGEIYKVSAQTIRDLDYLESNNISYKRMALPVQVVKNANGDVETVRCWMYVGKRDYWNSRSKRLEVVKRFRPASAPNNPYYCFTKMDQTLTNG